MRREIAEEAKRRMQRTWKEELRQRQQSEQEEGHFVHNCWSTFSWISFFKRNTHKNCLFTTLLAKNYSKLSERERKLEDASSKISDVRERLVAISDTSPKHCSFLITTLCILSKSGVCCGHMYISDFLTSKNLFDLLLHLSQMVLSLCVIISLF